MSFIMDLQSKPESPIDENTDTFPRKIVDHIKSSECRANIKLMEEITTIINLSKNQSSLPEHTPTCDNDSERFSETVAESSSETSDSDKSQSESDKLDSNSADQTLALDKPNDSESSKNLKEEEEKTSEAVAECNGIEKRRTLRNTKRKMENSLCCPVCGVTIRSSELNTHFHQEVEKLSKLPKNAKKMKYDDENSSVNMTYVQVKCNRENRLASKVSRYTARTVKEVKCPVCSLKMSGSEEDINKHVALCFQNEEELSEDEIVVDGDDDDEFEEYEFGNETRIRAISFVSGGYRSLEGQREIISKRRRIDEDEGLNVNVVDVDDTTSFGQPQYTELDVITNRREDDESGEELRKAVTINISGQPLVVESPKWTSVTESTDDQEENFRVLSPTNQIVSSLKEKIKELQDQNAIVKCLICMDSYTKPTVSTTCWHVYCEECWLRTMGVKKLCPQCNMIVFPSDLRRIYL